MRKILFSVFAGGIILLGCSKSSDNNSASIVGTWNANKLVALEYLNDSLVFGDTATTGTVVFKSDGTFTSTDSTGTDNGTYTYNTSSKVLTVIQGTDTTSANVTSLTSSDLHFNSSQIDEFNGDTYKLTTDQDYKR